MAYFRYRDTGQWHCYFGWTEFVLFYKLSSVLLAGIILDDQYHLPVLCHFSTGIVYPVYSEASYA